MHICIIYQAELKVLYDRMVALMLHCRVRRRLSSVVSVTLCIVAKY